jgi:carbonic anhydrase
MSCPKTTAPIDINKSNIAGKCDFKCEYTFHYNDSACVATNRGDYISLSYDSSSAPPVTYNSSAYDVKEIRIYSPSLHSFMGVKTDAELIIVHNSFSGSSPLFVCVPIKNSNSSNIASTNLNNIMTNVSKNAPADSEKTTINISRFNLNDFVPKKPFFSYTASEPFQPCYAYKTDYIVFTLPDAITISDSTLITLQKIISANLYDIKTGPKLFYNAKGPSSSKDTGQIYIDCQPVGQSEEENIIITDLGSSPINMKDLVNNKVFQAIAGSLFFVGLVYAAKVGLDSVKGKTSITTSVSK